MEPSGNELVDQPKPETSDSAVDKAKEAMRHFIEGEPMGTAKSKAFCDSIDIYVIRQQVKDSPEDKTLPIQEANISETIRQRRNEVPGYFSAYYKAIDLGQDLVRAMSDKANGRFPEVVLNHQASYELNNLKLDYLETASRQTQ